MPGIHPEDVLDQFEEIVPSAAANGDQYLRAIVQGVRFQQLPVAADMRLEPLIGGFRASKTDCLILTPTDSRLQRFEMLHYAVPVGQSLRIGWYLLGGVKAKGLGGWAILGGSTQMDMDNLQGLVQLVMECAVVPAVQDIADDAGLVSG
ncbi:MAG: hypothetical protein QOF85_399 [Solirubrobacterales bacterium]|jgi:hypothetical protein|nr:hypothetical protein [Solirubrobacterales bacterium]